MTSSEHTVHVGWISALLAPLLSRAFNSTRRSLFLMTNNVTSNATHTGTNDLGLGGMLLRFGSAERQIFFELFWTFGVVFLVLFTVAWCFLWKFLDFYIEISD